MNEVNEMLNDTSVQLISFASRKSIRKWVVCEVRYDYEWDGYCTHNLSTNEYCEFGTPIAAYRHAKNLVRKYRKQYCDATVIIKEVGVTLEDLQR